ncbi:glycine zipper 2TM domain-containing protein [Luteimonas sp. A277]
MNFRQISAAAAVAASLALAGCATPAGSYGSGYGNAPGYGSRACDSCGTVTRIERAGTTSSPNVIGPVLGGVVGAVAGKELARRNTDSDGRRNVATAGGAVAGAVAGNAIQNRVEGGAVYRVHVRMDNGRSTVVTQDNLDGLREGSYVRIQNGRAWAQ